MPQAPPPATSVHQISALRPAIAAIAAGLLASAALAAPPSGTHLWPTVRHPGPQRTVAPVRAEHPIHYPRSARSLPDRTPADELLDEFFELHTAMAYEEAAVVDERLVEIAPARAEAHYNRACVMGRLRRSDAALSSLEQAVEHGWRDLVHLSIDPDLDSVRGTPRYRAVVEQLRLDGHGRVDELQRSVPALLARDGVSAATMTIVQDGLIEWSATFGNGGVAVTTTTDDLGRLLEALCDATRATSKLSQAQFLELSQPTGDVALVLRWSPGLGRGVMVVTAGGDDGRTAGRIAALAVTVHQAGFFPNRR